MTDNFKPRIKLMKLEMYTNFQKCTNVVLEY